MLNRLERKDTIMDGWLFPVFPCGTAALVWFLLYHGTAAYAARRPGLYPGRVPGRLDNRSFHLSSRAGI